MKYAGILDHLNKAFLTKYDDVTVVETSLLIVTVISYIVPKRFELLAPLNTMLEENLDGLIQSDIVVRCRVAMLYGYYADSVLKENEARFKQILTFLFESLGMRGENKAIAIQACDTLCTVVCDQDIVPQIEGIIDSLLPIVNEFAISVEMELFFDFLGELTRIYKDVIGSEVLGVL